MKEYIFLDFIWNDKRTFVHAQCTVARIQIGNYFIRESNFIQFAIVIRNKNLKAVLCLYAWTYNN